MLGYLRGGVLKVVSSPFVNSQIFCGLIFQIGSLCLFLIDSYWMLNISNCSSLDTWASLYMVLKSVPLGSLTMH